MAGKEFRDARGIAQNIPWKRWKKDYADYHILEEWQWRSRVLADFEIEANMTDESRLLGMLKYCEHGALYLVNEALQDFLNRHLVRRSAIAKGMGYVRAIDSARDLTSFLYGFVGTGPIESENPEIKLAESNSVFDLPKAGATKAERPGRFAAAGVSAEDLAEASRLFARANRKGGFPGITVRDKAKTADSLAEELGVKRPPIRDQITYLEPDEILPVLPIQPDPYLDLLARAKANIKSAQDFFKHLQLNEGPIVEQVFKPYGLYRGCVVSHGPKVAGTAAERFYVSKLGPCQQAGPMSEMFDDVFWGIIGKPCAPDMLPIDGPTTTIRLSEINSVWAPGRNGALLWERGEDKKDG